MKISNRMRVGLTLIFFSFFFSLKYFNLGAHAELFNPLISSGSRMEEVLPSEVVSSDVPVSCVLSYGTFLVSQQDCDVLMDSEIDSSHENAIQCIAQGGTFLVSESECSILKNAVGSQDIMQRIDE